MRSVIFWALPDEDEMDALMEELGTIQDELTLHDFYVIDAKVEEVARALGLLDLGLDRDVTDLSGGQRTKVLLGKLLLEKPDILLLDEPTNYLDEEHIAWLKRYLLDYENAFILISHDIPFLNERSQYHLSYGKSGTEPLCGRLRSFPGSLCSKESTAGSCLPPSAAGDQ